MRWREWMRRVEAVVFAAARPVGRKALAAVVGRGCNLDRLLDDIRGELRARPSEIVSGGGRGPAPRPACRRPPGAGGAPALMRWSGWGAPTSSAPAPAWPPSAPPG